MLEAVVMRALAQKQNGPPRSVSSSPVTSIAAASGLNRHAKPVLHLQHTVGIQAVKRTSQTHAQEPEAGVAGPASPRFVHDFSRIPIHAPAAGVIQTKLAINKPGDSYEQEADRLAQQVVRTPESQLQRACPCRGGCAK